ncbi:MAG: prepilin-type N-terminal cleavage/methylation domain-containing protein, partial [Abditibacteriaceae bacterium]
MQHQNYKNESQRRPDSRRGFTLVEVLVALAIFVLLLVIILVPLNMGFTMLHLGKTKVDVQTTTQRVIDRMRGDLTKAIYVYPNDVVPTVTGIPTSPKLPYGDPALIAAGATSVPVNPYFDADPCTALSETTPPQGRVSNLSRIDMLLPETNNGNILSPVIPSYYIVTYYARRRDVTQGYQSIDNPIVLYRAQIPFRGSTVPAPPLPNSSHPDYLIKNDGTPVQPQTTGEVYLSSDTLNANIYDSRYANLGACGSNSTSVNRSAAWLQQSADGEPNLEPLTNENGAATPATPFTLYGSHIAVIPVSMGMVTGLSYKKSEIGYPLPPYGPKSTFICADTNKDGVIDQVT